MTTYGAYNAGLPCKNTACKSHGKPHPNCRCWGEYAKGGGVGAFCDEARSHQPECEYFAEGGDVPEGFQLEDPAPAETPESDVPEGFQLEPEHAADVPEGFSLEPEAPPAGHEKKRNVGGVTRALGLDGPDEPRSPNGGALGVIQDLDPAYDPEAKAGTPTADVLNAAAPDYERAFGVAALMTGGAGIKQVNQASAALAKFADLGKVGSSILKNLIAGNVIQGGNEVSDWMLGQGDPAHPVGAALAHMGVAGIINAATGGVGTLAGEGLKKLAVSKVAGKLGAFVAGFAAAAEHAPGEREAIHESMRVLGEYGHLPKGASMDAFKAGQKAFDNGLMHLPKSVAKGGGTVVGGKIGGLPGAILGNQIAEAIYKPLGNMVEKLARPVARKIVAPMTVKILSSGNTQGLLDAIGHADQVASGYAAISKGVNAILEPTARAAAVKGGSALGDMSRKKLDDWISKGGVQQEIQNEIYNQSAAPAPQGFAEGGEVEAPKSSEAHGQGIQENKGLAIHYPEQNMLMAMARGRISNYLTSLRPEDHAPRLAFDDAPDMKQKKRTYDRALDIAIRPLSIMDEIKKGALEAEHVKHFNALHPEIGGLLKKKITEGIVKSQVAGGKRPPYAVRQALSMFMGTALSAEMTPQNIQAAQRVFQQQGGSQQPPQGGGGGKPKSSTKSLTKSDDAFLTSNQARQTRMNKV